MRSLNYLKGDKLAISPVVQPSRLELIVNLKTAKRCDRRERLAALQTGDGRPLLPVTGVILSQLTRAR